MTNIKDELKLLETQIGQNERIKKYLDETIQENALEKPVANDRVTKMESAWPDKKLLK